MRNSHRPLQSVPATDYSQKVAEAIAWLGERYLLARPINCGRAGEWAHRRLEGVAGARVELLKPEVIPG